MTAKEIYESLLDRAISRYEVTGDGLVAGDANKVVHKVGTCFKLTAALIDKAAAENVDMVIAHEPTFSHGDAPKEGNRIDARKADAIQKSGITVYHFHDHAHNTEPDYIHEGFIRSVGLNIERALPRDCFGIRLYELSEPVTPRQVALQIREKLKVDIIKIVGSDDHTVKTVCLGLGGIGYPQLSKLFDPGCDLFIAGEVGEVCDAEYIRDACYYGENKAIIVMGHYSSEYAGMRYLAEKLNESGIPAVFLEGGEVYHPI